VLILAQKRRVFYGKKKKPRKKIPFLKRMWRKYGFPRIRRTRKYQKLRMKVMGYE
jgi:hypothetical protein